jgi:hypothetical protein
MQEDNSASAWPAAGGTRLRASDADRDAAAAVLCAAFAEGRLTAGEHEQRLGAAYGARTWQQLRQLTADLPAPAEPVPPAAMPAGVDRCLLCVLLIVCPPAGIAWWLLSRHRTLAGSHRPLSLASSTGGGAISDHGNRHAQDR